MQPVEVARELLAAYPEYPGVVRTCLFATGLVDLTRTFVSPGAKYDQAGREAVALTASISRRLLTLRRNMHKG